MNQVFDAVLEARFRQCPGHRKITRKEYSLRFDTQTKEIERTIDFRRSFLPGRRVEMSMVFEASRLKFNICPGCNLRCPESQEFQMSGTEWYNSLARHLSKYSRVNSSGCGLRYQHTFHQEGTKRPPFPSPGWSHTIIENSSHNQGPEYVEEDTPGQFRRVRVTCSIDLDEIVLKGVNNTFATQQSQPSYNDALDASRGMVQAFPYKSPPPSWIASVALSQYLTAPRDIYGNRNKRGSFDGYFPSTHWSQSSISDASYNPSSYYSGSVASSVSDYDL